MSGSATSTDRLENPGLTAELARRRSEFQKSWPAWEPRTFYDHFQFCARTWPDRPLLILDGVQWSYAQVAELSTRVAAGFHHRGIGPGDRVAVVLGSSAEFFAILIGLTRLGAITVPVNYLLGPDAMRYVLEHSAPKAVVFDRTILGRDIADVLDRTHLFTDPGTASVQIVRPEGTPVPAPWISLEDCLGEPGGTLPEVTAGPGGTCAIMYTTGSSGTPKGVLLTSDALLRESYGTALTRGYYPGWATLTALPPFHLFVLAQAVLPVTFVGGSVALQSRFDPRGQLEIAGAGRVNDIIGVAAMFYRLTDQLESFDHAAHPDWALKSIFLGGDALPESDWHHFRDAFGVEEVTSGFGMTELQGTSFMAPPESSNEVLAHTVGWPKKAGCAGIPGQDGTQHEWRLADPKTGGPVPDGTVGELLYRGQGVSPGYWRVPADQDPARADGWFHSGDLGKTRPDGAFVFAGRNSDVFRSGGELVSPAEVEGVISEVPGVAAAYVVGVPDRRFGSVGWVWLVAAADKPATAEAVIEHCRARMPRYKVPKYVFPIAADDVPLSASGKFLRRGLAERARLRLAEEPSAT
jgi:fatty-acyl-CoA synthase